MKQRRKFPIVLWSGLSIYSALVLLFGVSGYISFGSDIDSNIFNNIATNGFSTAADISITIMLLLTYPLMINPVIDLSERRIFAKYAELSDWAQFGSRGLAIPIQCRHIVFVEEGVALPPHRSFMYLFLMALCYCFTKEPGHPRRKGLYGGRFRERGTGAQ